MADKERLNKFSTSLNGFGERPNKAGQRLGEAGARFICASSELADGGDGVRFEVECNAETVPAFAIRHRGRVHAYLNRCAHIEMELDWKLGKFFDADGVYLICSTHGAMYAPESGACRGGPCRGAALSSLNVFEADGKVYMSKG